MSKPLDAGEIRNRITEVRQLRFGDVANNPNNPKIHPENQRDALRGSVRELGFGTVPVAYHSERLAGKLVWGDGHLRGDEFADYVGKVAITDFTDEEVDKFLLYADPIAALAEQDTERLDALLRTVQTGDAALQAMLAQMAEDAGIVPPDNQGATGGVDNIPAQWAIMIECDSEDEQSELLQRFSDEGIRCKALIS